MEAEMFARFAQFAAVALAMAIVAKANAASPLTYGTYYDEVSFANCTGTGTVCTILFSQLPSDKLLMVNKVNCRFLSSQPPTGILLGVSATSGGVNLGRFVNMALPAPGAAIGGFYATNIREDAHFLMGQGRFPTINLQLNVTSSFGQSSCTLIGDLVTPIQ
jgi:hypothetical protein